MTKRLPPEEAVIDLLSDEDDDETPHNSTTMLPSAPDPRSSTKKNKSETMQVSSEHPDSASAYDDVEVVSPVAPTIVPASVSKNGAMASDEDDVVVVGISKEQKLPHLRQNCLTHKYRDEPYFWNSDSNLGVGYHYNRSTLKANKVFCDQCYCYACDASVNDCKTWYSKNSTSLDANHCCANEKVHEWTRKRNMAIRRRQLKEKLKRARTPMQTNAAAATPSPANEPARSQQDRKVHVPSAATASVSIPHPGLADGTYHLREHCSVHKFQVATPSSSGVLPFPAVAENIYSCQNCWCFVCDKLANDCKNWRVAGRRGMKSNHCCATQNSAAWVSQRKVLKNMNESQIKDYLAQKRSMCGRKCECGGQIPYGSGHRCMPCIFREVSAERCANNK